MRYGFEWTPGIVLLGLVVVLPLAPGFALIGLVVLAVVALAAIVALVGAILATPYLVVRTIRRRYPELHLPLTAARATTRPGIAALAAPTTARRPQ
jgi:hypothetical protein